jgi:hypothetical protein
LDKGAAADAIGVERGWLIWVSGKKEDGKGGIGGKKENGQALIGFPVFKVSLMVDHIL